jgi:hypothetical protein
VLIGRLLKNSINAYFAFYIGFPLIDPLLSKIKTYSPLTDYMSISRFIPFLAAYSAILTSKEANFGMKEIITDVLESLLPSE